LREWVEAGAELVFGFAGDVGLAGDANVRMIRAGSLFLIL